MAKQKKSTSNNGELFPEFEGARYGANKLHRNIFIAKLLRKRSIKSDYWDNDTANAYERVLKWSELEASGRLQTKKETTLSGEFLTEVFGHALGLKLISNNPDTWNLTQEYPVNGGSADFAIGEFSESSDPKLFALGEIKGPRVNLDKDRFNGRTPVQQLWDYLNAVPDCPWGILTNYVSIRLYHRSHSNKSYQLFVLKDLPDKDIFAQFYYLFGPNGIIPETPAKESHALSLLNETGEQQRTVGDDLYGQYHRNRVKLIQYLTSNKCGKSMETAIHISQKLLDRIVFIAFCEDRGLLPSNALLNAYKQLPPFSKATNPRWQNYCDLFRSIDIGNKRRGITAFNGGLFREDPEVDDLNLDDRWTEFFRNIGNYDFRDEVNVDVLGHIFERSISDIGKIRLSGIIEDIEETDNRIRMGQSAERKRSGIYYTPPAFTEFIIRNTVGKIIHERFESTRQKLGIKQDKLYSEKPDKILSKYWSECLKLLKEIKIVDPACGSGAFLIAAYDQLEESYSDVINQIQFHDSNNKNSDSDKIPDYILQENLYGVDLSPQAVEITQLSLWLRSARDNHTLADLSDNIRCGNSLASELKVDPCAFNWSKEFKSIIDRPNSGFDGVIGNPPWERMKLQEREFFDAASDEIASAVSAATRRKLISKLKKSNPELLKRYEQAKKSASKNLDHARTSGDFPLTGKGDINTYAVFAELASKLVASNGRVGILVPSGIATDATTSQFFGSLVSEKRLYGLYDFENKAPIFADVHRSFKFSIFLFGGINIKSDKMDFVFFARAVEELRKKSGHVDLTAEDISLFNPNSKTCPIFRSPRDAAITIGIYERVPILVDKTREEGGNPWGIRFFTMFHQTNDAELFKNPEQLKTDGFKKKGSVWKKGKSTCLPLYEAKMIQMYDHRAASVVIEAENWMRQGQKAVTSLVQHQNPEFTVTPRWWAAEKEIQNSIIKQPALLGFKDVTSPTNRRTMIASMIPVSAVTNHFPLLITELSSKRITCLLACFNSFVLDFVARQKMGGITLNFFIVEQLPIFSPATFEKKCPWNKRQTLEKWISDRVLKLTCTSNDMIPLAEEVGLNPTVCKWDPAERAKLMAELDAAFFLLYGITRDDVEFILSTFAGLKKEESDMFSGNTTKLILDFYDKFNSKI